MTRLGILDRQLKMVLQMAGDAAGPDREIDGRFLCAMHSAVFEAMEPDGAVNYSFPGTLSMFPMFADVPEFSASEEAVRGFAAGRYWQANLSDMPAFEASTPPLVLMGRLLKWLEFRISIGAEAA